MELFTERLIKKQNGVLDYALAVLIVLAGLIISYIGFIFLANASLIVIALSVYGVYVLVPQVLSVEIEYTVTNEELDIDKIIGKSKRKSLGSYNIKEFTEGGRYNGEAATFLCPSKNSENLYILKKDDIAIVIDPNETMLRAFEIHMGARFKRWNTLQGQIL